jgi:hypothetical protein
MAIQEEEEIEIREDDGDQIVTPIEKKKRIYVNKVNPNVLKNLEKGRAVRMANLEKRRQEKIEKREKEEKEEKVEKSVTREESDSEEEIEVVETQKKRPPKKRVMDTGGNIVSVPNVEQIMDIAGNRIEDIIQTRLSEEMEAYQYAQHVAKEEKKAKKALEKQRKLKPYANVKFRDANGNIVF